MQIKIQKNQVQIPSSISISNKFQVSLDTKFKFQHEFQVSQFNKFKIPQNNFQV
jgi:hypothetical protein